MDYFLLHQILMSFSFIFIFLRFSFLSHLLFYRSLCIFITTYSPYLVFPNLFPASACLHLRQVDVLNVFPVSARLHLRQVAAIPTPVFISGKLELSFALLLFLSHTNIIIAFQLRLIG